MIDLGLAGVAGDRHRLFLEPFRRRRAGVRVVGFSEPDATARDDFAVLHPAPAFADHREMLTRAGPTMIAIADAGEATGVIARDALAAGADVIIAPPLVVPPGRLDDLAALATRYGRRLTMAYGHRNHPAARLARELVGQGRLGQVRRLVLDVSAAVPDERTTVAAAEVLDLFRRLTGVTGGTVSGSVGVRADGDAEQEVVMTVTGTGPSGEVSCAVVRQTGPVDREAPAESPYLIRLAGESGEVAWEVTTGRFRSVIEEVVSPVISAGLPGDPAPWVLTDLIRRPEPSTPGQELLPTRLCLLAEESTQRGGAALEWRL